jgi:hypothetical protein
VAAPGERLGIMRMRHLSFPKIQILSVKDWFDGKTIKLPSDQLNPFKCVKEIADQKGLFQ